MPIVAPPSRPPVSDSLISVVLPVFNEAGVLVELCQRLRNALTQCRTTFEIIFVNDGSTDSSGELLDQLARQSLDVRVAHLTRNFGHQAAIAAGLSLARGDAIILMDSDLQDTPDAIGELLEAWQAGYDVVYAVRTHRKEQIWKRILFSGFHRLLAAISQTRIPIDAGNFGLVDARVARTIVSMAETDRYFPGLRSWVGYKQIGIPIQRGPRYDGKPRVSLRGLFRLAKTAIFSFSTAPIRIFAWLGCIALCVLTVSVATAVYCQFFTAGSAASVWRLAAVSFFAALNALAVSVLGEYLVRIYDQVRGRPAYLIDRTVNFVIEDSADRYLRGEQSGEFGLEKIDPLELDGDWDDAYQHLLAQTDDLLELGSLMRSEEDDYADRSRSQIDEATESANGDASDAENEPRLLKFTDVHG